MFDDITNTPMGLLKGVKNVTNNHRNRSVLLRHLKAGLLYQLSCPAGGQSFIILDVLTKYTHINTGKTIINIYKPVNSDGNILTNCASEFSEIIIYKNIPILISLTQATDNDAGELIFYVLKARDHVKTLHVFLDRLFKKANIDYMKNRLAIRTYGGSRAYMRPCDIIPRSFDDVFIPDKIQNELIYSIDKYINKYEWYKEHKIPNHFGILLHGKPGTGKTSIVQAISNQFDLPINSIPCDRLNNISSILTHEIGLKPKTKDEYRIVLIEDIDCCKLSNRDNDDNMIFISNDKNGKSGGTDGFGTLINSIDGIGSASNVIYIFTTNNIDGIDPALIRPGRIDLKLEIDGVCPETFDKFCMFHFNKHVPDIDTIVIKETTSFAELQVMVMKEMTMDEIIKEITVSDTSVD